MSPLPAADHQASSQGCSTSCATTKSYFYSGIYA
ncbi:uncharacterized protein An11g00850 [Aspergillus niger]|uniref:Contig An11c0040, genomic contig n=2 Tax=Aspergillus niger TaxID=5061 RepID=A2QVB9_ASPNC|nr:uncharacterized protein An11g00850 [Aspergillus niger]CAK96876.1 unnamed protein product [Aspergillus niger]